MSSLQFRLSLVGGILILAGGIVSTIWFLADFPPAFDPLSELRDDIAEQEFFWFQIRYIVAGMSTGMAVIITSFMLKRKPEESRRWGIMLVVLSGMSILGMGGFLVGMGLGVVGGVLAIIRSSEERAMEKRGLQPLETASHEVDMTFRCASCDISFRTDADLRMHVAKAHVER